MKKLQTQNEGSESVRVDAFVMRFVWWRRCLFIVVCSVFAAANTAGAIIGERWQHVVAAVLMSFLVGVNIGLTRSDKYSA